MSDLVTRSVHLARADLDIDHCTCCRDSDLSLCGMDVSDVDWGEFDVASCHVCADLDAQDGCPFGMAGCWA